ncbi:hypothetical protein [Xanthomonas sp. XNM01]|uniref:hypothetical protein n=1 Tax=Xanthomonas sp. XNM01 TaxID=2769289 RepID=UPI00177EB0BA|nr:hypothetical protein [Xanthomonas sp. XNM01]MBD9368853.1 hypothetical protein [Xanthomonas sp. XNM01]
MSLVSKLTVKPLLYVAGGLFAALVATATGWWIDHTTAAADLSVQAAAAASANASDQANRTRVRELQAANAGYASTVGALQAELRRAQAQVVTVRRQADQAVAAADARAADADHVLKTFMDRYAVQVKQTHCAQALMHVEAVCPAFSGY